MVSVPVVEIRQWTPSIDPSGYRISDNAGDLATAGYVKSLTTAGDGALLFGSVNTSVSGQVTPTKMLTAHVDSWGDASGILNMKFFLTSVSDFTTGEARNLYRMERHWHDSLALTEADASLPTSAPSTTNLVSTLGSGVLADTSFADESQCTQYIWVAMYIHTDVPVGTYGGPGGGGLRYRLLFDFL